MENIRPFPIRPVARVPKTAELIAERLRSQIIRAELKHGDLLPNEAELSGRFRVSRPTLREALRILESETLLEIGRGIRGGAKVVVPSERTAARYVGRYLQFQRVPMSDVHEATIAIELPAVISLARQHGPSDLASLNKVLLEEAQRLDEDFVAAVSTGNDFHRLLVDLAGNRTLAILHGMIEEVIVATNREIAEDHQLQFQVEGRRSHEMHKEILNLITNHDVESAERLWREHLKAQVQWLEGIRQHRNRDPDLVDVS